MAPPRPPPTEHQLQQSEEWKQKGNAAFRLKNFTEAFSSYTEAIALNPTSHFLYSNRSAALLSLGRHPLALNDAKRAIELDPKWSKGYRRKATVLDAMKRYRDALVVYEEALAVTRLDDSLSDDQKKKEEVEVKKLMIALSKKLNARPEHPGILHTQRDLENSPGILIVREAERRAQQGVPFGSWPPIGSCFRRLWIAEMQFHNALIHLNEYNTVEVMVPRSDQPEPLIYGQLQTLEELTTAMTEDIRVARMDHVLLGKLRMCLQLEQQRRNAIGPNMSPRDTIQEYLRRLTEPVSSRQVFETGAGTGSTMAVGWDYVRPALQLSIRSSLICGFIKDVFAEGEIGDEEFRRCVDLIEEARAQWPDVSGGVRGRTLEETFLRQIKVHLAESLARKYMQNPSDPNRIKFLDEIISITMWIIHSFENNPHPPEDEKHTTPAGEPGWWTVYYTHYVAPLAKAHNLFAFANLRYGMDVEHVALNSKETGARGPIASSPSRLGVAAIHYATAAAWMPPDEPERANALWYAIFSMVRRGGYYLADFEIIRDMATKSPGFFIPFIPAEAVPENHAGKHAAAEVLGTSAGGEPDMICSPMVQWPDDVPTDMNILEEVMNPWTREIVNGPGGGLLALTEVMRNVWKDRVEKWGEKKEYMGADKIWDDLEGDLKTNWDQVWKEHQAEGNLTFGPRAIGGL